MDRDMNKLFTVFIVIGFLFLQPALGQSHNTILQQEVQKKGLEYKKHLNFHKAHLFFLENNWDSTLVYSMRHLSKGGNLNELNDYSHYFRAFSLLEKKLLKAAKKEFESISNKFRFLYLVKIYLGEIALYQKELHPSILQTSGCRGHLQFWVVERSELPFHFLFPTFYL